MIKHQYNYNIFSERSRSRSLYAVARPSVVCLSVTLVHPTQAIVIFGNISTALSHHCHCHIWWQWLNFFISYPCQLFSATL